VIYKESGLSLRLCFGCACASERKIFAMPEPIRFANNIYNALLQALNCVYVINSVILHSRSLQFGFETSWTFSVFCQQ